MMHHTHKTTILIFQHRLLEIFYINSGYGYCLLEDELRGASFYRHISGRVIGFLLTSKSDTMIMIHMINLSKMFVVWDVKMIAD